MGQWRNKLMIDVITRLEDTTTAVNKLKKKNTGLCKVYGLDCEWDINHTRGMVSKPDLLQIGTCDGYCALFRLNRLKMVPPELKDFLEDPAYTKVGVAVLEDTGKLKESFGVTTKGVVDIRFLADDAGIDPRGLSSLSETVLMEPCVKHNWRFHQWTGSLSEEQKSYAAIDAVYGARIFMMLNHQRLLMRWGKAWKSWSGEEYNARTVELWANYFNKPFDYERSKFVIAKIVNDILRLSDLSTKLAVKQPS